LSLWGSGGEVGGGFHDDKAIAGARAAVAGMLPEINVFLSQLKYLAGDSLDVVLSTLLAMTLEEAGEDEGGEKVACGMDTEEEEEAEEEEEEEGGGGGGGK